MTNMTSSTNNNNKQSQQTHIDFSIHSIIHGRPSRSSNVVCSGFGNPTTGDTHSKLGNAIPEAGDTIQQQSYNHQQQTTVRKYRPKNFQCPACKMAFSNNGQLKNHVRIHTGERPFHCDLANCRKTFTRNEELTRHKLIHTGFRPHACTTCGKRFGRKDHLKKHLRTHERKKLRRRVSLVTNRHQVVAVSSDSSLVGAYYPNVEPAVASDRYLNKQQPNVKSLSCVSAYSAQDIPSFSQTLVSNPQTASLLSHHLPSTTTTTFAAQCTAKASPLHEPLFMPSNTIQQLATDYWNRWYNIFGFYHHHPPVVVPAPTVVPQTKSSMDSLFNKQA